MLTLYLYITHNTQWFSNVAEHMYILVNESVCCDDGDTYLFWFQNVIATHNTLCYTFHYYVLKYFLQR